ncbi:MAG: PIN domain-containing protein [Armatimonadota bacterium]|nr:PIN domain-containing protein [Armatimonadota bacterium]MDR7452008.1 PIN domain-containing protein [Armatimonadota bacterium]MDR7467899.1 PIN domain-containing protein [Armatimonadota bacterium]MDR7494248.1 PIN domain-containing protein [Armatimonadota bacterium]MDR7500029.1 PIN domain-containing protein [Armatimonadota bacterium]
MTSPAQAVVYWDSSAILSALFKDRHSARAAAAARTAGLHLLSSLAWAEVHAVIARIAREQVLAGVLVEAARETLEHGPWRRVTVAPDWRQVGALASRWPLRGADLWHLGAAKTLQRELPALRVLTFDARLAEAARAEGLA